MRTGPGKLPSGDFGSLLRNKRGAEAALAPAYAVGMAEAERADSAPPTGPRRTYRPLVRPLELGWRSVRDSTLAREWRDRKNAIVGYTSSSLISGGRE